MEMHPGGHIEKIKVFPDGESFQVQLGLDHDPLPYMMLDVAEVMVMVVVNHLL